MNVKALKVEQIKTPVTDTFQCSDFTSLKPKKTTVKMLKSNGHTFIGKITDGDSWGALGRGSVNVTLCGHQHHLVGYFYDRYPYTILQKGNPLGYGAIRV